MINFSKINVCSRKSLCWKMMETFPVILMVDNIRQGNPFLAVKSSLQQILSYRPHSIQSFPDGTGSLKHRWARPGAIPLILWWPTLYSVPSHTIITARSVELAHRGLSGPIWWFVLSCDRGSLSERFHACALEADCARVSRSVSFWSRIDIELPRFTPEHVLGVATAPFGDNIPVHTRYKSFSFRVDLCHQRLLTLPKVYSILGTMFFEEKIMGRKEILLRRFGPFPRSFLLSEFH